MPDLSIVIPTIGRDAEFRRVLEGLVTQDVHEFELVVVCSSIHPDPAAVEAAVAGLPFPTRVVRSTRFGASASRNTGIDAAHGPLLLFLDDDVVPRPELVREHLAWHARHPERDVGVLGLVVWASGIRVTPFMRWLEHGIQFDYENILGVDAGWQRFYTANVSIKRELADAVGGFDEVRLPFGYEDLDLAKRMHDEHGFRLLFNRAAVGEHLHEITLDGWRANAERNARGELAFIAKHPEAPAYFRDLFLAAEKRPPASGRGRYLAWVVRRPGGWLGDRVWKSADIWFRQQLAPDFLAAWDAYAGDAAAPSEGRATR